LLEHPLHVETLADMQLEFRAAFLLAFRVVELLGREESGEATGAELQLLRLLIPVAKLYTARQAIAIASETLESFGGAGYVEDTGIPRLLRDAQVLSIWEGTTNILSLDALRAIGRTDALDVWIADVRHRLGEVIAAGLQASVERTRAAVQRIAEYGARAEKEGSEFQQTGARSFAFAIARLEAATLLIEHAVADPTGASVAAARRWAARDLTSLVDGGNAHREESGALAEVDLIV
jgi:putative acyl-CoA dehydrogenase